MAFNGYDFKPPTYISATTVGANGSYVASTANTFNIMVATSAISLGIRLDELAEFMYAVNAEGVTALAPIDVIYKGILNAAMKVIDKRGE